MGNMQRVVRIRAATHTAAALMLFLHVVASRIADDDYLAFPVIHEREALLSDRDKRLWVDGLVLVEYLRT